MFHMADVDKDSHRAQWDRMIRGALLGAWLIYDVSALPTLAQDIIGTASVIDGDTLEIHGRNIRLHWVDAPEESQLCLQADGTSYRCGQQAALRLSDFIGRRTVTCSPKDKDRYGRVVAVCSVGQIQVNDWLVRNGWGLAYRKYSLDYVDAENDARAHSVGIWQGKFEYPWDLREGSRAITGQQTPKQFSNVGSRSSGFTCAGKQTCGQMTSCAEAKLYLTQCGVRSLDSDGDGIPCEKLCR